MENSFEKNNILFSDRELKENIEKASNETASKAARVVAMQFNFKDDPSKTLTYGVIAQDVEALGLHELVHVDKDGNKGVDYTSLMILQLEYFKERIAFLSMRIKELEEKLNNGK